jgi:hypothetical protein
MPRDSAETHGRHPSATQAAVSQPLARLSEVMEKEGCSSAGLWKSGIPVCPHWRNRMLRLMAHPCETCPPVVARNPRALTAAVDIYPALNHGRDIGSVARDSMLTIQCQALWVTEMRGHARTAYLHEAA